MIIDGRSIAKIVLEDVSQRVQKLAKSPRLAAILVGMPPELRESEEQARKFLKLKESIARRVGMDFKLYEFKASIKTRELRKEIVAIAKASANSGLIVQLPLPFAINSQYVLNAIPAVKDPDMLSQQAQGLYFVGRSEIVPPAVESIKLIFQTHNVAIQGKHCVVFGYGQLVGKQVSHWLMMQGATVTVVNEFTPDQATLARQADVIISGVGKADLITADMVKNSAVILDFGYNTHDGKIVGDVAFDEVAVKASLITPVPGGVGPLVIATFLKNLVTLAEDHA